MAVTQPGRNSRSEAPGSGLQPTATCGSTRSGLVGGSSKGQGAAHPAGGVGAGGGCRLAPPKGSTQRHCQAVGPTIFPTFVETGRCR